MMTQAPRRATPPIQTRPKQEETPQLTLLDHLKELRWRLFVVVGVLMLGVTAGYSLYQPLADILLRPLQGQKLIYLTPGGGFDFIFQISFNFGLVCTIPVAIYHIYRYLAPLMPSYGRKFVAAVVCASALLAVAGVCFGYFVAVPSALHFLTSFASDYVQANLTASSYLNFVLVYLAGLALLFQVPLILLLINTLGGPLQPKQLWSSQRYIILGAFVAAAMITPTPDITNQSMLAGPIIGIYQLGVGMVLMQNRVGGGLAHRRKKNLTHVPRLHTASTIPDEVVRYVEQLSQPPSSTGQHILAIRSSSVAGRRSLPQATLRTRTVPLRAKPQRVLRSAIVTQPSSPARGMPSRQSIALSRRQGSVSVDGFSLSSNA